MAAILTWWHRPRRGRGAGTGRPDPPARRDGASRHPAGAVTRSWVVLMIALLAFAALSAVVILAH